MSGARRGALSALLAVTEQGAYANLALKQTLQGLGEQETKWASAAVYTVLDHLYYIDAVIARFAKGRVQPQVRGILRLGVAQALYMRVPPSAACDESVKLAKQIGKGALAGYVNGVMRNICRNLEDLPPLPQETNARLCMQYSYPAWLVEAYVARYGEAFTEGMLKGAQHPMTVRAQYPYTTSALLQEFHGRGIGCAAGNIVPDAVKLETGLNLAAEPLFKEGKLTVQSESAMLVCRALSPAPGLRILDACAAPGGKTAYLSHLMRGEGHITAWELHAHRAELMRKTLERLHVNNAEVSVRDAAVYDASFAGAFDAVLLDAPCSGLGVPGKPDARYAKSPAILSELAELQGSLLRACAAYVRPGGILLYATCAISEQENEAQIARFLREHEDFAPQALPDLPASLADRAAGGVLQLFPHIDATEGFFMARMVRHDG
ncbi:MAG: 16S rRNA (cytosine(967)-C(5))-methyltransferase RsmB [Christensenellaceae bacterium]|jgi:16S rRNA (cytosine967-C5)-methyltransferase|nr:16S rRNA (cytosine(967)-C(5))-methyltransferase RsmB [Christensenellaceae bacterium]